jgi:Secretion system C-terminal sorting domain
LYAFSINKLKAQARKVPVKTVPFFVDTQSSREHLVNPISYFISFKFIITPFGFIPIIDSLPKKRSSQIFQNNNFLKEGFGTPNKDNSIAISYNKIVDILLEANNDGLSVLDPNSNNNPNPLFKFWIDNNQGILIPSSKPGLLAYDPKIIFDASAKPNRNKFIFCILSKTEDNTATNKISTKLHIGIGDASIVGTTATLTFNIKVFDEIILNIPTNKWMDRINIGMSEEMFYLTTNLPDDIGFGNATWRLYGFKKDDLYSNNLSTSYYKYDIQYPDPLNVQNKIQTWGVMPVSYGHEGNYGPGIYLLANDKNTNNGQSTKIIDMSKDMNNIPIYTYSDISLNSTYFTPSPVLQPNGGAVNIASPNFCNVLDAFYLHNGTSGKIYYTFTSGNNTNTDNTIIYNKYNLNLSSTAENKIGKSNSSYLYPSLASYGLDNKTEDVVIGFQVCDQSTFVESKAVGVDGSGNLSTELILKMGENSLTEDRWGDYSSTVRYHKASKPTVWHSGAYAADGFDENNNPIVHGRTWVSEISTFPLSNKNLKSNLKYPSIYPTIIENQTIQINLNDFSINSSLEIYDIQGRLVNKKIISQNNQMIKIDEMKKGIYIFKIIDKTNNTYYENTIIIN